VKFAGFAHVLPERLDGKSVLDIGCNGGFYSIEMARRGAARVLGVDHDEAYLEQARFAAEVSGYSDIDFGCWRCSTWPCCANASTSSSSWASSTTCAIRCWRWT
jgi:predicted RNA methylase